MADDVAAQIARLRKRIETLRQAMGSGVLTVEGPDTGRVTYRSYSEMRQALGDLNRDLAALEQQQGGGVRRTRQIVMTGRSGW